MKRNTWHLCMAFLSIILVVPMWAGLTQAAVKTLESKVADQNLLNKLEPARDDAPAGRQPVISTTYKSIKDDVRGDNLLQFTAGGHVLGFRQGEMYIAAADHALKVEFVGARFVSPVEKAKSPSTSGSSQVAHPLGIVTYPDLWHGVSLVYERSANGFVKSTYHIAKGTRPSQVDKIRLAYNVPVQLDDSGKLLLNFKTGRLSESVPIAWQEIEGERIPVDVAFRIVGEKEVGFKVGAYDPAFALVIDPELSWNTFMGSPGPPSGTDDFGQAIAVDASGNVYVAGQSPLTWGTPINPHTGGGYDAFAAKFNSAGVLQWHTFMGSDAPASFDYGNAIAVDGSGNVYVVGYSPGIWGTAPLNPHAGGTDTFAAKLDSNGVLQWYTFMGSGNTDRGNGIAVDASGDIYVAGDSQATWGSPVNPYVGGRETFAAKLDSSGARQWNTFMGSATNDVGEGIAVDASGNVYVTGQSQATWGSPVNPYAGGTDAFVAKLNGSGARQWNTFMGSSNVDTNDFGEGIAVDASGNVYMSGYSDATWGSPVNAHAGGNDAFASKLDSSGVLQWHTFMGSATNDYGEGITVDASGNVYMSGFSDGTWGSPVNPYAGGTDAFVAKLNSSGARQWNTFMGSSDFDDSRAIAVDASENIYVVGTSFSTWGTPVNAFAGHSDAFVAKLINLVSPGTYYVDISQSSEGDGSAGNPWKTLHYAIQQINSGDPGTYTLNVAAGTYSVANLEADDTLVISQDNVTIQGAGAGNTIIYGGDLASWFIGIEINASNVTISGLEVSNFINNGINIYTGTGQIVEDCDIHDNSWGIYTSSTGPEIRKNKIYDNTKGIYITVFDTAAYAPVIKNNLIYTPAGTMEYGIEVNAASTGSKASPSIYHNTIDGGSQDGIYIHEETFPSAHDIKYNIITNFGQYGINNDPGLPGNPVIEYNDVYGNAFNYGGNLTDPTGTNGNISQDPSYVASGDYHLQSSSPCIDAIPTGDPPNDPVSDDIVGNTRPQGSGYDMGCYESSVANAWHTFMGSVSIDDGYAVAVDGSGNIYVAGYSYATWGTPVNPHTGGSGFCDTFVAQLNNSGELQWNTFMGSSAINDFGYSIAVDGSGDVYVTGYSYATWGTPVNAYAGGIEAFVAKLNSSGALQWNTFMGSAAMNDLAHGVAVDSSENVYVTGESSVTWGSPVNAFAGSYDAFAAKLNSSGARQWNTFMGSANPDLGGGVAVDASGNVCLTGWSDATWGLPVNAFAGNQDVFAAQLNSSGVRQWHTFMGSSDFDDSRAIAVDASENIYVAGTSYSTWGSPDNPHAGNYDAFAVKLNSGGALQWHAFMGSANIDESYGIAVDGSGNVYVAGYSYATWGTPVNAYAGDRDAFVAKFELGGVSPTTYNLTVNTTGQGSVTLNPTGGTYDESTVVTLTAVADSGWDFSAWSGDLTGSTNPETITMDSDKNVTATFTEVTPTQYTLTVNIVGQGSVDPPTGGTYDEGTVVTLSAIPDSGCNFIEWSGALTGSTTPETITMDSDKTVTATFNCPPDTPTTSSPADEAIFAEGTGTVPFDTSAFLDLDGDTHTESHWLIKRADSVYYRADYDTSFNTVVTTGDLTQHTVSGLSSGMKYVWKVGYTDSGSLETSWSQEYDFKIGTSVADSSVEIDSGTEEEDFKMKSFVQWPDHSTASSVFDLTYDKKNFRIGTYDPTNGSGGYVEYGSSLMIEPGKAYWFLARDGLPITVNGIPVSLFDDIDVGLLYNASDENGWNMIGCPNAANYNWDDVQVIEYNPNDGSIVFGPTAISLLPDPNDYIDKRLWRWESGEYYSDATLMEKYEGYWVEAKKPNVFLRFRESVQTASISNPPTYFARLLTKGKRWMKRWIFTPHVAIADSDDSPPRPMGDFSTVSPKSVGGCFIATAVYGSPMERHVRILRDFRDTYLLSSRIGHMFVNAYYRYSPPVADFIAKHRTLKTAVRMGLLPLVAFCYSALHFGMAVSACGLLLIFMPFIFLVLVYQRRRV